MVLVIGGTPIAGGLVGAGGMGLLYSTSFLHAGFLGLGALWLASYLGSGGFGGHLAQSYSHHGGGYSDYGPPLMTEGYGHGDSHYRRQDPRFGSEEGYYPRDRPLGYRRKRRDIQKKKWRQHLKEVYSPHVRLTVGERYMKVLSEQDKDNCGLLFVCEMVAQGNQNMTTTESQLLNVIDDGESKIGHPSVLEEYWRAREHGQHGGDCGKLYSNCGYTFQQIKEMIIQTEHQLNNTRTSGEHL